MMKRVKSKLVLSLCATATAVIAASPAAAQAEAGDAGAEPAAADGAAASSGPGEADIVVTAQLRSQSLQKVPAAVTALDDSLLETRGATSLTQITQLAPALRITALRSQTFVFLRGVGQALSAPNADPQVAVNVNGVYVPSEMSNAAFFDVERIEVVPGPQGTLYGRNATGGVINVFSKRPGDEMSANGFVEVGNYGRVNGLVAASVPLTDTFGIRAAASITRHDGYYTNGMNSQETFGGRLTAVWRPDAATTVTAIGTFVHDGGLPDGAQLNPARTSNPRFLGFDPKSFGAANDVRTAMASLEVARDIGKDVRLTYIGGYNDFELDSVSSFFPVPAGNTDVPVPFSSDQTNKSTSHELRLNISSGRLDAVFGAYYFWNDAFYEVILTGVRGQSLTAKSEGEAVFGQATYTLFDELRLTGGLRYSHTKKSLTGANLNPPNASTVLPFQGEGSENRLDWRAGIEFDIAPRSMLYANIQTGFTPGGFSSATTSLATTQASRFDTVKLLAYSAGIKNRLFDDKLTLNAEGFYYDYKNYQVAARDPTTLQVNVYNAQKARIYGAQVDIDLRITPNDRLTLGAVYVNAKATRLVLPNGATAFGPGGVPISDLSGFDLPYAPRWTINASYEHIFPLASGAQIEMLANTQYASGQWLLFNHAPFSRMSDKMRTDLTLTYRPANGRWSIAAWVRNLENATVLTYGAAPAINAPPFPALFTLDAPRTYGGRLTFDF